VFSGVDINAVDKDTTESKKNIKPALPKATASLLDQEGIFSIKFD